MKLNLLIRLKELDKHIKKGNTGNAECLSKKIGISRKQLYNYLEELTDIGISIKYCRKHKNFYYEQECKLTIECKIEFLDVSDTINLFGGRKMSLCNEATQTLNNFASANYHNTKLRIGDSDSL